MPELRKIDRLTALVLGGTAAILLGLLGRVAYLQTHVTANDRAKLVAQHTVDEPLMARRAAIYASDSTLLAGSVRMYNLFADPGYIIDPKGTLNALQGTQERQAFILLSRTLSPLIHMPAAAIRQDISAHLRYKDGSLRRFLYLSKQRGQKFYDAFQSAKRKLHLAARRAFAKNHANRALVLYHALDGVGFTRSTKRVYPLGPLAGQVIGFANVNTGLQGLENQCNDLLRGRAGHVILVKDAGRQTLYIRHGGFRAPRDGDSVWLTLNTTMQGYAEHALDRACGQFQAVSGAAVIMDPYNGHILAMANYPPFNPADFQHSNPDFRRNRAVTDPYEPGSVIKPFTVGWAIQHHVIKMTDTFFCHDGRYRDPTGRLITDVEGYGTLTVENILVHSSNIGMTQIGWKLGIPRLYAALHAYGFGQVTGCELPGDNPGIVRPERAWTKGTLTSASFGYGIAVTPLQLARALCTLANGGYRITPRILLAVETRPGHLTSWNAIAGPPMEKRILSPATALQVRLAMEQVMLRGTGRNAISPYYRMFGKTGTANLAIAGQDRYAAHEYNATFICGSPVIHPRLIAVVSVHRPNPKYGHYGGTVAAPACSHMLQKSLLYLQVPPDQLASAVKLATGPKNAALSH